MLKMSYDENIRRFTSEFVISSFFWEAVALKARRAIPLRTTGIALVDSMFLDGMEGR